MGSIRAMWLAVFVIATLGACSSVTPKTEDSGVNGAEDGDGDSGDGDSGDGDSGDGDSGDGDSGDGDSGDGDDSAVTCESLDCADSAVCDESTDEPVCKCPDGYEDLNGDASECAVTCASLKCMAPAVCDESGDAPTCKCPDGYDDKNGDGSECEDIDECADSELNDCAQRANCANTDGGYTCECRSPRYAGDGKTCTCAEGYEPDPADASRCLASNGTACDDDLNCASDSCVGGTCCSQACDAPGTCRTTDGATCSDGETCAYPKAPEGTACADGDACTVDMCDADGVCQGTAVDPATYCTQGSDCQVPSCDSVVGCLYSNAAAGIACDDGDPCTAVDQCDGAGVCAGSGLPAACDDGEECTNDGCMPDGAGGFVCENLARTGTCSAPDSCATGGMCSGGACQGTGNACGAGNPQCTPGQPNVCMCDMPEYVLDGTSHTCVPNDNECQTSANPCVAAAACNDPSTAVGDATCTCPANLVGDGLIAGTGCTPCTGTYTKAVNGACVCDLAGNFAMQIVSTVSWAAQSSGVEGASNVVLRSWSLRSHTYDNNGNLTVSERPCGGDTPETCVNNIIAVTEAWSGYIPNAVWDATASSTPATTPLTRAAVAIPNATMGQPFRTPPVAAFAGIYLTPAQALTYWPSSRSDNAVTWVDSEGDGALGVTTQWITGGNSSICPRNSSGAWNYDYPVTLSATLSPAFRRVKEVYGASRVISSLNGTFASCDKITGTVNGSDPDDLTSFYQTNARVLGCRLSDSDPGFPGQDCASVSAGLVDFLDGEADNSPQVIDNATFVIKRLSQANPTCADVRNVDYAAP